jgi:NADH-quinone oxidoreductase subunit N
VQLFPENIARDLWLLWPEIAIAVLIVMLLMTQMAVGKNHRQWSSWIVSTGLSGILAALVAQPAGETQVFFSEMLLVSSLTWQFHVLLVSGTLLTVLLGQIFPPKSFADDSKPEYYTLLCGTLLGLLLMVRAQNLLMLFMALETASVCSYGLVFFASSKKATEAGVKYILFGIFSSALMLYGISLWWSATGGLSLAQIPSDMLPEWGVRLVFLLILSGLLFKTSAAPFHIWTPDVLEGAPLPVAAFFAVVPKIGALAVVMILLTTAASQFLVLSLLSTLAVLTLLIGTLAAIRQTNTRRLMAYSAIAQAGFMLAAVIAQVPQALIYYLWVYLMLNFLAFAVIAQVESEVQSQEITAFAGIGKAVPLAGIAMLVAMAGLIGLPPTAGFAAKLLVFSALWQQWQQLHNSWLLLLFISGLVATVISVYFYFKIPYQTFFRDGQVFNQLTLLQRLWLAVLSIAVIALLVLNS